VSVLRNPTINRVTLSIGQHTWSEECNYLACGFGLVPNVELPLALGCELKDGFVRVDCNQATSVPNVYCAGEPTGIGGADCALIEGQIAVYAATNNAKADAVSAPHGTASEPHLPPLSHCVPNSNP
jgi:pyruvate/2-oxoglutarate dehydrogenase complex dihydrolipoamide dehydrogenase (E3) component